MEETNMEKNIDIAENDAKQYIVVKRQRTVRN